MSAGILSPVAVDSPTIVRRRVRSTIIPATAGDHPAIYYFLAENFGAPSLAEFRASVDDPFYEPCDRLLLRRNGRIVGHTHVTHRLMQFGPVQIPVAGLGWLATSLQCRGQGLGMHLLLGAERHMAASGALVGLLRTRVPHFFRRTGWALCGRDHAAMAGTHAVLARLLEHGFRQVRQNRLHIRPWRRWEEGGLARVYRENLAGSYGMLDRSAAYWRWLLHRKAFDQLYVALDGPDLWDFQQTSTHVVGYAAIKGGRIVEVMTSPGRQKAGIELVARACGDAIEQNRHAIVLHAPPKSPLLEIFDEADGRRHDRDSDCGEVTMAPPARSARVAPSLAWRILASSEGGRIAPSRRAWIAGGRPQVSH